MTISALAGDAFEGGIDRAERARVGDRIRQMSDHERYEADWPAARHDPRDWAVPARRSWRFDRR